MNNLPVYLTDNTLCNTIARILMEKTGLPRSAIWKRACTLASYIRDKRDLTHHLKCEIEWIDRFAFESISRRLNKRLDKIFATQYKTKAKKLDNESQPIDWLMV